MPWIESPLETETRRSYFGGRLQITKVYRERVWVPTENDLKRREQRNIAIWGSVIGAAVLGVMALGIYAGEQIIRNYQSDARARQDAAYHQTVMETQQKTLAAEVRLDFSKREQEISRLVKAGNYGAARKRLEQAREYAFASGLRRQIIREEINKGFFKAESSYLKGDMRTMRDALDSVEVFAYMRGDILQQDNIPRFPWRVSLEEKLLNEKYLTMMALFGS